MITVCLVMRLISLCILKVSMVTSIRKKRIVIILGEPEKVPTFENSQHDEYFTFLNDSKSR